MSRLMKQLVYSAVYLVILVFLGAAIYVIFLPEQSCENNRHDWGEEGVDCGGRCGNSCLPATLRQITVSEPRFFVRGDTVGVLVRLTNPNSDYGAQAYRYRLEFLAEDKVLRTREVTTFLYPDEVRYQVEFADVTGAEGITKVRAAGGQVTWISAESFGRPNVAILDRATRTEGSLIRGTGRLVNQEPTEVTEAVVIALYYDRFGLAGVSKTELGSLEGGESKEFSVIHPALENIEPQRTEYYAVARRVSSR